MSKRSTFLFEPQHELLDSMRDELPSTPSFAATFEAHGLYETMHFVLRLSPVNHELMASIEENGYQLDGLSSEAIQAYSTYIHETVHWWQHVGSTSGLLYSLSFLAQCHSSMGELREILATIGAKKPLMRYTDQVLMREGDSAQERLAQANIAVNNAIDVEFYKSFAHAPRTNIVWMRNDPHFESVGHDYAVVYGQLLGMMADTIDPEHQIVPSTKGWDEELARLNRDRVQGYFHGSPVLIPAVGLHAVYEGQARFLQLQFLNGVRAEPLSSNEWRARGFLSGIYVEAFEAFLTLSETEWPEQLDGSVAALFLLICDLAINPTRGVPLEISDFAGLIQDVDVGIRFTQLSQSVAKLPRLKEAIIDCSRSEYIAVSDVLTRAVGYDSPHKGLLAVKNWEDQSPGLSELMEEYRRFDFGLTNLPLRVFISHFIAFYWDKWKHPEFFCWAGMYLSGQRELAGSRDLWLRHLSLFGDRGDRSGIYPRMSPGRSEKAIKNTFDRFYGNIILYDLTRQWILNDGPFVIDQRWLYERYDQERTEAFAKEVFRKVYGVDLDEFEIVP